MKPQHLIILALVILGGAIILDIIATRAEMRYWEANPATRIIEGNCVVVDKNTCVKMQNPVDNPDSQ